MGTGVKAHSEFDFPGVSMDRKRADPNSPYGERSNFLKLTVAIPPTVYERLIREIARRKIAGEANQFLSSGCRSWRMNLYI
jgi:hypothetical protein